MDGPNPKTHSITHTYLPLNGRAENVSPRMVRHAWPARQKPPTKSTDDASSFPKSEPDDAATKRLDHQCDNQALKVSLWEVDGKLVSTYAANFIWRLTGRSSKPWSEGVTLQPVYLHFCGMQLLMPLTGVVVAAVVVSC